jgi:hypothetical protein
MPSANRDPQGSTKATRAYSIIPSFTEASRVYSVILQRQSLDYIRHALNMYFRFPFFLSFLKFEILVNKGSPVAIKLPTPLTMADGSTPFKPAIIFHGKGAVARREHYDDRVDLHFNETAYNNEDLFHTWLQNIYQPYVTQQACGIEESLIVMDAAAFHKTEAIRIFIKQAQPPIRTAIIPPGLTSLMKPLDTAVNGPFKQLLHEADLYLKELEKRGVCPTPGL